MYIILNSYIKYLILLISYNLSQILNNFIILSWQMVQYYTNLYIKIHKDTSKHTYNHTHSEYKH